MKLRGSKVERKKKCRRLKERPLLPGLQLDEKLDVGVGKNIIEATTNHSNKPSS